jgi:4-hydroxy-4-methyl-2-oxoglutarate aldolase
VSGSVRDLTAIHARRFPVFHRGVGPRPAAKFHEGELGAPVQIEGVTISPGDLVVADADGVVLVPLALVERVHADVATLERRESEIVPLLERGRSTLDVLGLS